MSEGGIVNAVSDLTSFNLNVFGHIWYPIDQMVFFGIGGGYNELDNVGYIPVMASAWIRLPIGGQTLPVATGDIGYAFGDDSQYDLARRWRFRYQDGDYSSILLMGGYQFLEIAAKVRLSASRNLGGIVVRDLGSRG
jgi:hypothetical protein